MESPTTSRAGGIRTELVVKCLSGTDSFFAKSDMNRNKSLSGPELFEARYCFDGSGLASVVAMADVAEGEPNEDFSLNDVNSTSATFGQAVSPSDFRGGVSAWYYGRAT